MIGGPSVEAYGLRMTGEGLFYRERLRLWVRFPDYDMDLAAVSLATNC